MKTNYISHDEAYGWLRTQGMAGWSKTEEAYDLRKSQLRDVLASISLPPHARTLELGCGAGNISVWLAHLGYAVTGADISPKAIDWARSRAADEGVNVEFLIGDVLCLDALADNSFDFVLDGNCFHCIIGEDRQRFLSEAYRLLKPGGCFSTDTMCAPVNANMVEGYDERSKCSFRNGFAARYYGLPDEIRAEVISAGFAIISDKVLIEEANGNITINATKLRKGNSS